MKKINIDSRQTHFIGSWNLENKKLCNEIISFFENNKNLARFWPEFWKIIRTSGKFRSPQILKGGFLLLIPRYTARKISRTTYDNSKCSYDLRRNRPPPQNLTLLMNLRVCGTMFSYYLC